MEEFKHLLKDKVSVLPKSSGVYCFKGGEGFLDIGKASNLRKRVRSHFQQPDYRAGFFINQVSKIGYLEMGSEIEALILEAKLIKKFQPKYNILWRDDKIITHQSIRAPASLTRPGLIGPFVEGVALNPVPGAISAFARDQSQTRKNTKKISKI